MVNKQQKGDRIERELVNKLDVRGAEVLRSPASGSATKRELPDVTIANRNKIKIAIESKSSADNVIYIDGEEIYELLTFCKNFGATPRLGIRFDREEWRFLSISQLYMTKKGNFRIKKDKAMSKGETLERLLDLEE